MQFEMKCFENSVLKQKINTVSSDDKVRRISVNIS